MLRSEIGYFLNMGQREDGVAELRGDMATLSQPVPVGVSRKMVCHDTKTLQNPGIDSERLADDQSPDQ